VSALVAGLRMQLSILTCSLTVSLARTLVNAFDRRVSCRIIYEYIGFLQSSVRDYFQRKWHLTQLSSALLCPKGDQFSVFLLWHYFNATGIGVVARIHPKNILTHKKMHLQFTH
jgi:hypothetical protein